MITSYWLQKLVELRPSKKIGSNEPWDLGHLLRPVSDQFVTISLFGLIRQCSCITASIALHGFSLYVPRISKIRAISSHDFPFLFFSGSYQLLRSPSCNYKMSDYTSWTTDRVASWVEGISPVFKKYASDFRGGVSGDMLLDLDDEALVERGILLKLHRKRILRAVSDLAVPLKNDVEETSDEKVLGPKTEGNSAGGPSKKAKIETYVGTMVSMPKPKGKAANSLASSIDFFNDQDQHHRRLTHHRQISPTNQQQMSATKSRKMRNRTIIVESLTGGLS